MQSLLSVFQKQRVSEKRSAFRLDHFGAMWNKASEEHRRFLLRVAFLQESPEVKPWGAYTEEEQRALHTFGLWAEEFADFQKAVKSRSKQFEKRINQAD